MKLDVKSFEEKFDAFMAERHKYSKEDMREIKQQLEKLIALGKAVLAKGEKQNTSQT